MRYFFMIMIIAASVAWVMMIYDSDAQTPWPIALEDAKQVATTKASMIDEKQAVEIARKAIGDRLRLPTDDLARVESRKVYLVTWKHPPLPANLATGSYVARVVVDAETGQVLQVLAGS